MNKRIKLLADQAEDYATAEYEKWIPTPDFSGIPHIRKIFNEKFAELIVEQFDLILVNEYLDCVGENDKKSQFRVDRLRKRVKEYFGVEE